MAEEARSFHWTGFSNALWKHRQPGNNPGYGTGDRGYPGYDRLRSLDVLPVANQTDPEARRSIEQCSANIQTAAQSTRAYRSRPTRAAYAIGQRLPA